MLDIVSFPKIFIFKEVNTHLVFRPPVSLVDQLLLPKRENAENDCRPDKKWKEDGIWDCECNPTGKRFFDAMNSIKLLIFYKLSLLIHV